MYLGVCIGTYQIASIALYRWQTWRDEVKLTGLQKEISDRGGSVAQYAYEPLDPDAKEIRLLELLPAEDEKDMVRINLQSFALPDRENMSYEAISYCWGPAGDWTLVLCGDRCLSGVPFNLFLALRRLRMKDRPRLLWADAISINQSDDVEKSWQVQMMGDIYRGASKVLIWLGDDRDDSHLLEPFILRLAMTGRWGDIDAEFLSLRRLMPRLGSYGIVSRIYFNRYYRALDRLVRRPWFSRVWVIQEFALAEDVKMLCGSWSLSLGMFDMMWDFVAHELRVWKEMGMELGFSRFTIPSLLQTRSEIQAEKQVPLLHLMIRHIFSQATDPRDKIFALKELSANARDFKVDYAKSVSRVYQDAALYIMSQDQNLDILAMMPTSKDPSLPSWAPDWRLSLESTPILVLPFMLGKPSPHNASGGSTYVPVLSSDGAKLQVLAQRVDLVLQVESRCKISEGGLWSNSDNLWTIGEWARICNAFGTQTYERTGETALEAFRQACALGIKWLVGKTPSANHDLSVAMSRFESTIRIARFIGGPRAVYKWLPSRYFILPLLGRLRGSEVDYYRSIMNATYGRALVKTQHGYIGFASGDLLVGDTVFLLAGGKAPYVLRKKDGGAENEYTVVGDCFLHGFLDGTEWELSQCQHILLC
jgi:hypothetical protein